MQIPILYPVTSTSIPCCPVDLTLLTPALSRAWSPQSIMKYLFVVCTLLFLSASCLLAADVEKPASKKPGEAPKKLTTEEYDREAELRISNFKLPEDIKATLFADPAQTQNPSAICFDEKGRMYIAEIHRWRAGVQDIRNEQRLLAQDIAIQSSADRLAMYQRDIMSRPLAFYSEFSDRIVVVEDSDKDGRADTSSVWADGFNDPLDGPGIGVLSGGNGTIYYTNIPHIWKLDDTDGDGNADKRESIQEGFGVRMSLSGHDMHGLVQGPDGKIYWSIGDRGYSITTKEGRHYHRPTEGAVFRCDPDGSNVEEYYRGLRNPQELAFDQFGNLFTCDNNADAWDTGRLVYILEGGDTGWRFGNQALLIFRDQLGLRTPDYEHPGHSEVPLNPWTAEGVWEPQHEGRPAWALPPIDRVSWGPSGFVYNYGVTAMPERYANHFWICNFGGAKGDLESFSVKERGAGFELDHHEVFMEGLGITDVEFGPDGRMYLCCFNNNGWYKQDIGNIYALSDEKAAKAAIVKQTHELLLSDFGSMTNGELDQLLAHPDMRVRQRAQFDLVRRKDSAMLAKASQETENRLKRLHGIWGLGQLARANHDLLDLVIPLLDNSDSEVRAQAAKVLADSRTEKAGEALVAALDDESARVKSFAAIGVGKCRNVNALDRLLEILAENNNQDVFLRHSCVQGMWYLNEREKILKKINDDSAALRLGVLLTLRKLEDPRVKYFLNDSEPFIREEAIRAINDLNLITALPELAEKIEPFAAATGEVKMPEDHRDWMIQTRLINANFRLGKAENANRLLEYAAQPKLPEVLREQALKAIAEWPEPTAVDPTVGYHRPLDPATRGDISEIVKDQMPAVFRTVNGKLLALATEIALQYDAKVPVDLLTQQIKDGAADLDARIGSVKGLAKQQPDALEPLWDSLFESEKAALRATAAETLLKLDESRGLKRALSLANSDNLRDRQNAYRLLAGNKSPEVAALFANRLADFQNEKPGALLDLLEATAVREEEEIKSLLATYNQRLDATDPLSAFQPCLTGGDPKIGRTLFMTHAAGQCAKCHRIDKDGGEAGPDLSEIGARSDAKYILESLINPSAVVVPGYGLTLVTLQNGESIGGTLMEENGPSIFMKYPDPKAPEKQITREIPLSEIASRQPPVSAMPPMIGLMKKSEIRDLVAFLASLKEKKEK